MTTLKGMGVDGPEGGDAPPQMQAHSLPDRG